MHKITTILLLLLFLQTIQGQQYQYVIGCCSVSCCYSQCNGGYANRVGTNYCNQCMPGSYTPNLPQHYTSCILCPAGFYQPNGAATECLQCPVGSYSNTVGGNSTSSCLKCPAGTYSSILAANSCLPCPEGTYSSITGATSIAQCLPCPGGSFSTKLGANSSSLCLPCPAGSYTNSTGGTSDAACIKCRAGTYSSTIMANSSTICLPCPPGKFSVSLGAISNTTCSDCIPGTFSIGGASDCTLCPASSYATVFGATSNSSCQPCPNGMTADAGATVCVCQAGYQPTAKLCVACPEGTYKSDVGNFTCTTCGANLFSTVIGATNDSVCSACLPNTSFIFGSSGCACDAGFEPNGALCSPCSAGTYKSTTGNFSCSPCPASTYSISPGATTLSACLSCDATMGSFPGSSVCSCNPGFEVTGSTCAQCPAGTFKSAVGNWSCTPCAVNTYSTAVRATSANVCVSCGNNLGSSVGSSSCSCKPGFEVDGSTCSQCTAGTYKSAVGNWSCTPCAAGTFSTVEGASISTVCLPCSANMGSAAGSSVCSCNPGFELNGGSCVQCSASFFKANIGNVSCTSCATNQYSVAGALSCLNCGANSASTTGSASCSCNAGYQMSGATCVACTSGTYKSLPGNITTCIACGANSGSSDGASACICNAGFQPNEASCVQCPAGSYKTASGNYSCNPCLANTFSTIVGATSASVCQPCGNNSESSIGSTSCSCIAGYELDGSNCVECPAGTFKTTTGNSKCTLCTSGTYSSIIGASASTVCSICGANAVSTPGSSLCACNAGFEPNGELCSPCSAGTYKTASGNSSCTSCATNTYSNSIGASSVSSCVACSVNMGSSVGSSSCSCNPGFEVNGDSCSQCPAGSYKSAVGNWTCTPCSSNTYSTSVGATSENDCLSCDPNSSSLPGSSSCLCNAGFESSGSACVACPIGKFKAQLGNSSCVSCSSNQNSLLGATECYTCAATASPPSSPVSPYYCPPGQEPNGAFCSACRAGTFKSSISNSTCVNCDASLYSLPGATVCVSCGSNSVATSGSTTCSCRAGYYPNNSSCIACPVNTYKSNIGNDSCANCGANTTSNGTACFCLITHFGNPESGCLPCSNNKTRLQTTSSYTSDADCTVDTTNTDLPTTPNPPTNSANANPLASMMGVSNEIFFAIIGSVGGVMLIALISATIVIRKKFQNQQQQLVQATRRGVVASMGQQNPEAGNFAPLIGNAIMPYSTNNRTSNMMSLQRQGSIYPSNGMSTTYTGVTNGTTAHSFGGATLATTGPNWRQ